MLFFSWLLGVSKQEDPRVYFLFSISIIAEYGVQAVCAPHPASKVLPVLLMVGNLAVCGVSLKQLFDGAAAGVTVASIQWIPWLSIVLITVNVIIAVFIPAEPPTPPGPPNAPPSGGRRQTEQLAEQT